MDNVVYDPQFVGFSVHSLNSRTQADVDCLHQFPQSGIRAAFRQAYGIDLYRDRLHWIEFTELMNALPEGSRYAEVVGIRARPMPEPTKWNKKEREWLMQAKADVALELSEDEIAEEYKRGVANLAALLKTMAKGSENNG